MAGPGLSLADPLNLVQLRAFLAIVDTGGFREAATALGCAQPTVSQLLRKCEEALGVPLVLRSHTRCLPTVAGQQLLPMARALLRTEQRARAAVAGRQVTVGASSNIGIYLLPSQLQALGKATGAQIELEIGSNPQIAERLETGQIDVALMEWWDGRPGFTAHDWRQENVVVIVAPDHPWAARGAIEFDELASETLIGGEPGSGTATLLRQALGERAAALRMGPLLGSTEAVKRAVMAGLGVSLVIAGAVAEEAAHGSLAVVALRGVRLEKTLRVILPAQLPHSAPAQRFAAALMA